MNKNPFGNRRAKACVSFCTGITTEQLEQYVRDEQFLPGLLVTLKAMHRVIETAHLAPNTPLSAGDEKLLGELYAENPQLPKLR